MSRLNSSSLHLNFGMKSLYKDIDRKLFVCIVLISFISYGQEIFNFSLSIDDEFGIDPNYRMLWIGLNRWGNSLFYLLCHEWLYVPTLTTICACLVLSIASYITSVLIFKDRLSQLICSSLIVSCPAIAYQFEFAFQCLPVATGILLASIGIYILNQIIIEKKCKLLDVLIVVAWTYVISTYHPNFSANIRW